MTSSMTNQCINCGKPAAVHIRRDELFGTGPEAVIIENIPMVKCLSCGLVYIEPEVSQRIDQICAQPERYTLMEQKAVAKIA